MTYVRSTTEVQDEGPMERGTTRTYVVGHVNPDTDAIASAMGYAWLLNSRNGSEVKAARAGSINEQTAWALERLSLEAPEFLSDASPRFGAIVRRLDTVRPDQPLGEAWAIANRTGFAAPVVDDEGKPVGIITAFSLFRLMSELVGKDIDRPGKPLNEIFALPSESAADKGVPKFQDAWRIRDLLPRILREERNEFWVVDENGTYLGVCRQRDLLDPPRLRIILVDHNEAEQSIGALDEAELLEVLDHHRLDNPATRTPIRFSVEPVGSTSTLVTERIQEAGMSAPPALAGMLLAGLLSDTLILSSPTTTDRDQQVAETLGRWAFVGGAPLEGESVESFGRQLLQAGAGLATRDPDAVVTGDLKIYDEAGSRFGIAQVEVTDMMELTDHLDELRAALGRLRDKRGLDFTMLMVTDVVGGSSRLLMESAPPALDELPYQPLADGTLQAQGVVSRKKQLLPVILALLEE
ncbi:MAG: DHH family phosphoesterase [Anaerolineales bacterium]|nr:DHH family phosphoesterase [Anaerolineales bacterium]